MLLVTDKGILKAGLLNDAAAGFKSAGVDTVVFDRVTNDPPESIVRSAVDVAGSSGVDGVVGFGGGSPMDVAKVVSYIAKSGQDLDSLYGVGNAISSSRLPLIQVPTTAGTGSEVTPISILTTGENEKKGVVDPVLIPDYAVLDATTTQSLPRHTTAATGVDAMVHAIEAYTSVPLKNTISDALAVNALRLLRRNIQTVCDDPGQLEARQSMLVGSLLAGMAFANAPVAAVHALAYPIGSHFHVAHGLSNALMLPHVLRFNAGDEIGARQYSELAGVLSPGLDRDASVDVRVSAMINGLEALCVDLGLETRLSDVGIGADDIEMLATEAMKQTRLLPNNPREVTLKDARRLYRGAL